jgi:hypothetical protein
VPGSLPGPSEPASLTNPSDADGEIDVDLSSHGAGQLTTPSFAVTKQAPPPELVTAPPSGLHFVTVIGMVCRFGLASSAFGRCTVSTPSLNSAAIFLSSIPPGNGSVRWNEPKRRSHM